MDYPQMITELLMHNKDAVDAYFSCYQEPLEKSIKIIQHKISSKELFTIAEKEGWTLTDPMLIKNGDVYYIQRENAQQWLWKHWLHAWGFFYMQELAASLSAPFIDIQAWDIILDMCAAPWWKSAQLADKLLCTRSPWMIVCNEINNKRVVSLQHNLNRTSMYNTCITNMQGWVFGNLTPEFFNHVLVDAPCSGEWTWFKSAAGTKRRREENVHKIAVLQKEILCSAIKACKVWWNIVYSTCTINPWENEFVVQYVLEKYGSVLEIENIDIVGKSSGIPSRHWSSLLTESDSQKVARFWPHIQHTWGFFIAKLRKKASVTWATSTSITHKKPQSQLHFSQSFQEFVADILLTDFGIVVDTKKHFFVSSQKQIYLTTPLFPDIHDKLDVAKTGIPIFKWNNDKDVRPLHGLGNTLWGLATKNTYTLPEESLQRYSEWFDIPYDTTRQQLTTSHKYGILLYKDRGFSIWKFTDGTIKNKFMK